MKVVSVINYKGGVGKTTVTANLAADMARRGKKVLVIDLDPQTNLTFSFMTVYEWKTYYEESKTIRSWFYSIIRDRPNTPKPHFEDLTVKKCGIDIICSHLGLIDVDVELAAGLGGPLSLRNWNYIKTYSYIKNELSRLSDEYDVVLFDCPPNFSTVTRNALVASDYYVIPAKMDYLSTLGISHLQTEIDNLVKDYNTCIDEEPEYSDANHIIPKFLGVIATMVQIRNGDLISTLSAQRFALELNGIIVFDNMVRNNNRVFPDSLNEHKPVVLHHYPSSQVTEYGIVQELKALTAEFMQKVDL